MGDNNYYAGADLVADQRSRVPVVSSGANVPRSNQYAPGPSYQQQPDSRSNYYSSQPGPAAAQAQQQFPTQPNDPYYGRGQGASGYDPQDAYDSRQYQDYSSQPPLASSSNIPATSNTSSRRERERDPDVRDRHHRSGRR